MFSLGVLLPLLVAKDALVQQCPPQVMKDLVRVSAPSGAHVVKVLQGVQEG